jgi:hypothetical protein
MRLGLRSISIVLTIALSACAGDNIAGTTPATTNPIDEPRLKRHFAIMDEDEDGFISRPEFQSERGAIFLAVDRNNSFTLTSDEMHVTPEAFQKIAGDNGVVDIGAFQLGRYIIRKDRRGQ